MSEDRKTNNDLVQIVKGKQLTYLTFWCYDCQQPHTIAVRQPQEIIPASAPTGAFFTWNGSTTEPTIEWGRHCISFGFCHNVIVDGIIIREATRLYNGVISGYRQPLKPVAEWTFRPFIRKNHGQKSR